LVVGLGNPGREHVNTRHNVGFMVAEALIERWGLGRAKDRFRGRIAEGRLGGPAAGTDAGARPRVAVLCPQTYMNDSGRSVGPARGALKLALERVLVVYDEIDLPFGEVRARSGGGLAGHNGLKSLKRELGGADFGRVRVGVGRPDSSDPEIVSAWVLGKFREGEQQVQELIERACEEVERVVIGQDAAAGEEPSGGGEEPSGGGGGRGHERGARPGQGSPPEGDAS
jgi:PTH1 family peptidyl-tRNA hydrolase